MYFGSACTAFFPRGAGFGRLGCFLENLTQIGSTPGRNPDRFPPPSRNSFARRAISRPSSHSRLSRTPFRAGSGALSAVAVTVRSFMQAHPLQDNGCVIAQRHLSGTVTFSRMVTVQASAGRGIVGPGAVVHHVFARCRSQTYSQSRIPAPACRESEGMNLRRSRKRRAIFGNDGGVVALRRSCRPRPPEPACRRGRPNLLPCSFLRAINMRRFQIFVTHALRVWRSCQHLRGGTEAVRMIVNAARVGASATASLPLRSRLD